MKHRLPTIASPETQIARFAIAQFLLFEATVESLAALAESVAQLRGRRPGKAIDTDWTGTLATGSVVLTDVNTAVAAEGTVEAMVEATEGRRVGGHAARRHCG